MKPFALGIILLTLLGTAACETPDRYPISGAPCGPEDPVKDLNSANCRPPA